MAIIDPLFAILDCCDCFECTRRGIFLTKRGKPNSELRRKEEYARIRPEEKRC